MSAGALLLSVLLEKGFPETGAGLWADGCWLAGWSAVWLAGWLGRGINLAVPRQNYIHNPPIYLPTAAAMLYNKEYVWRWDLQSAARLGEAGGRVVAG